MAKGKMTKRKTNNYKIQTNRKNRFSRKVMIPKSIRYNSDEYHTVFYSTATQNELMTIANDATTFQGIGADFKLSYCNNISSWERLFEEYRINKIVVKFKACQTQVKNRAVVVGNPQTTDVPEQTAIPYAYFLIDRNDVVAPTSAEQIKRYTGTVQKQAIHDHTIVFTPSTLSPVYQSQDSSTGAISYNYAVDYKKKFLQNNLAEVSKDVPYFGIKYGISPANPPGAYRYKVSCKYYITFRKRQQ